MGEDTQQPMEPDGDESVDELSRRHVQFRMENTVLSDHLTRLITRKGSDHFHLQLEALEEDIRQTEDGSEARRTSRSSLRVPPEDGAESVGRDSRLGSLRRSSRGSLKARPSSPPELLLPLSLEEKSEIAEDECAAVKLQTCRYRDESERILDDIKAVIQETELSIVEIKKEKNSFQREVMFEAEMRHSKFASTDRILSYLQDKLKGKHVLIAKLQEKNDLLQTQIADAERQFTSKKDLADILHAVDFDQLTIQNQQLMTKIRDRTHEFHRIKASSNKASQALEIVRKHLQNLQAEGIHVKEKLNEDFSKLTRAKEEIKSCNRTKKKLKELLDIGTQESDGPSPPNAIEYMRLKDAAQRLQKDVERWRKKIHVVCH